MRKTKRALALILSALLITGLGACGKTDGSKGNKAGKGNAVESYRASEAVELPEYKGLSVTISGDYSKEAALKSLIQTRAPYIRDDSQKTVQKDSVINVDYVGKTDGEAFEGGSATDQFLDVAANMDPVKLTGFIDGFTSGLPGSEVGSTVDVPVTFPEDYSAPLAGKDAVFTFTINYICKPLTADGLTDEIVSQYFGLRTVDDLEKEAESQAKANRENDVRQAVIDQLKETAKVTVPKDLLTKRVSDYEDRFKASVTAQGQDFEDYLSTSYGMTVEDFEKEIKKEMKDSLESELIFEAVAEKEKLKLDKKGFSAYKKNIMSQLKAEKEDDLFLYYGKTKEEGQAYLERLYLADKACDLVAGEAKVKEAKK